MIIETKFNVGDRVYVISSCYKEISLNTPCPACNGTSRTTLFGVTVPCVSAFGQGIICRNGILIELKKMWIPKSHTFFIEKIEIEADDDETCIIYEEYDYEGYNSVEEDRCFATFEEARAECDRRNNGIA